MTTHRWEIIDVAGRPWEVSADAVKVAGIRVVSSYMFAIAWAKKLDAQLPPPEVLDARWEQADLQNEPHTQRLGAGENDHELHSQLIDVDIANHGSQPRIVGNCGKCWVAASAGGYPLYGWHVETDEPTWRKIKLHPAASSLTTARVIQPYSPTAHGPTHKDYSSTVVLARPLSATETVPDTDPSPAASWHDGLDLGALSLGERCLAWLGYQYGLGVREIPGPRHDKRILSYSTHCRRGGRFLGVRDDGVPAWGTNGGVPLPLPTDDADSPWCAALASETLRCALLPGEQPPHGLRVAVRELVEDAREADTLRPTTWDPTPGSLAICARSGYSPLLGGPGHVRAVVGLDGERVLCLGGNESDTVTCAFHRRDDPELRAWIER